MGNDSVGDESKPRAGWDQDGVIDLTDSSEAEELEEKTLDKGIREKLRVNERRGLPTLPPGVVNKVSKQGNYFNTVTKEWTQFPPLWFWVGDEAILDDPNKRDALQRVQIVQKASPNHPEDVRF